MTKRTNDGKRRINIDRLKFDYTPLDLDARTRKRLSSDARAYTRGPILAIVESTLTDMFTTTKIMIKAIHLIVACKNRPPMEEEIQHARFLLLPTDRHIFRVLPPADEYKTSDPYAVHLYCPGRGLAIS